MRACLLRTRRIVRRKPNVTAASARRQAQRRPRRKPGYCLRKPSSVSLKACVASRCPRWPTPAKTLTFASRHARRQRLRQRRVLAHFRAQFRRRERPPRRIVVVRAHDEQGRSIDKRNLVRHRLGIDHLVGIDERLEPALIFAALPDLFAQLDERLDRARRQAQRIVGHQLFAIAVRGQLAFMAGKLFVRHRRNVKAIVLEANRRIKDKVVDARPVRARKPDGQHPAHRVANEVEAVDVKTVEERDRLARHRVETISERGFGRLAEADLVRSHDPIARLAQRLDGRLPIARGEVPAMQKDDGPAV